MTATGPGSAGPQREMATPLTAAVRSAVIAGDGASLDACVRELLGGEVSAREILEGTEVELAYRTTGDARPLSEVVEENLLRIARQPSKLPVTTRGYAP